MRILIGTVQVTAFLATACFSEEGIWFTDQAEVAGITALNIFGKEDKTYILEAHGSGAGISQLDDLDESDLYDSIGDFVANTH